MDSASLDPTTILAISIVLAGSASVAMYLLRRKPQDRLGIALLAACCLGFALAYQGFLPDDSYITYRYAQNLLQGHGLVFNPGEYVLSTTTPFYTLLLALAGVLWPDLPITSHILSLPALFGGAVALYLLLARRGKSLTGLLLAVLYIFNPLMAAVYSSESILYVALVLLALLAYDTDHWEWAAGLSGLAVLTRGDGALIALALGLHWLFTKRWKRISWYRLWRVLLIYAIVALPWYIFSWFYYGSLAPATLTAKMAQGKLPGAILFWPGLTVRWFGYTNASPLYWLILPLAAVGLLLCLREQDYRWTVPTLLWAGLYTTGFSLLGVTDYQNYYTPLAPVLLLLAMLGADWLGSRLSHLQNLRLRLASIVPVLFTIAIGTAFAITGILLYPRLPQARAIIYQQVGEWIRSNTPPQSSVAMIEVGTLGYYANRQIIDLYGLIQPDVSIHMAQRDLRWTLPHYQPDYVVFWPPHIPEYADPQWFEQHYQPLKSFTYARCELLNAACSPLVVYIRK